MHPKYIKTCRVCGNSALVPVIDLGEQFLQGSFVKSGQPMPPRRKLPTQLIRCDVTQSDSACGLLQMAHTYPPEVLYANYWYRSGINDTMRRHLGGIVNALLPLLPPPRPPLPSPLLSPGESNGGSNGGKPLTVLDIGCNDGTLLRHYPAGTRLFGVDPSDIARSIGDDVFLVNTVFPSKQAMSLLGKERFNVITSIAMFYDLEDPIGFAKGVASLLADDGIWCLEMSYMPLMLLQNAFDTICHEHLEYYSLAALERILRAAGFRIFKVELNSINGGSIRCYACNENNTGLGGVEDNDNMRRLRLAEFSMCLDTDAPYAAFQERIEGLKERAQTLMRDIMSRRQSVHVYGASTKGNVLLQWYGLDRAFIEAAADRNPEKDGACTLGTEIPIISEERSRAAGPDYYLVLPWHFKAEFLRREEAAIRNGSSFIFPLPELCIVDKDNLEEAIAEAEGGESICSLDVFARAVEKLF